MGPGPWWGEEGYYRLGGGVRRVYDVSMERPYLEVSSVLRKLPELNDPLSTQSSPDSGSQEWEGHSVGEGHGKVRMSGTGLVCPSGRPHPSSPFINPPYSS